jgi:hypothetical protein
VLNGQVVRDKAGLAVALASLIAAGVCALAALCYAKFPSTVPVAGVDAMMHVFTAMDTVDRMTMCPSLRRPDSTARCRGTGGSATRTGLQQHRSHDSESIAA